MNNIVDAVNQNSTNAIQAAVLARLFGGAQNNPVMGGINQAEPPAQDFVSNAMNNPKPTVMPQLAGARGEVSGRGGAMGGIGDALMNMYNSRIARSENEVAQSQAEKAAELLAQRQAATQAAIADRQMKDDERRETMRRSDPMYAIKLEQEQIRLNALRNAQSSAPKGGSGGGSESQGMMPGVSRKGVNELMVRAREYDPVSKKVIFNRNLVESEAEKGNPNAVHIIENLQNEETKMDEKNMRSYEHFEAKRKKAQEDNDVEKAIEYADLANAYKAKLSRGKPVAKPAPQPQAQGTPQPSVNDLLQKAALLGKPQPKVQVPQAPAPETFVNPQPELLY